MYYYYNKLENFVLNICKDLMYCYGIYLIINVNICFVLVFILYVYYIVRFVNIYVYEVNY